MARAIYIRCIYDSSQPNIFTTRTIAASQYGTSNAHTQQHTYIHIHTSIHIATHTQVYTKQHTHKYTHSNTPDTAVHEVLVAGQQAHHAGHAARRQRVSGSRGLPNTNMILRASCTGKRPLRRGTSMQHAGQNSGEGGGQIKE